MIGHVLSSMNEVISNNYSNSHKALDIVSNNHTEENIIALESGLVTTVVSNIMTTNHNSKGLATYGNYVKIKQNNGKTALYAHMKYGSIQVNVGDYVEKGTIIGTMGETGNAYGKHLHLEIKTENNINENPIISLNDTSTLNQETTEEKKDTLEITTTHENIQKVETQIEEPNTETAENIEYLNASNYQYGSIVDALKSINVDSSYNYRKQLASVNNITNYHGLYNQNIMMLNLLKQGKLKKF